MSSTYILFTATAEFTDNIINTTADFSDNIISADAEWITRITSIPASDIYDGEYTVTPKVVAQSLATTNKYMQDDVTVLEIPYYQTSNPQDGYTVYIGNEV